MLAIHTLMLYECRFCTQGFIGHPGDACPDCGANDEEFPSGYLHAHPASPPDRRAGNRRGRSRV